MRMRQAVRALLFTIGAFVLLIVAALLPTPLRIWAGPPAGLLFGSAVLPQAIEVCGRNYGLDASRTTRTRAEALAWSGAPFVVVDPWLPGCTAGACTRSADVEPCATVVFVEVRPDELVGYALSGGP